MNPDEPEDVPFGIDPAASQKIFLGMLLLVAGGALTYLAFRPKPTPPPAAIASDPLLVEGRSIYLDRCAGCHGPEGKGDGPTARFVQGPPVGDLSDGRWKHGDEPEKVVGVIALGAPDSQMPGWHAILGSDGVRSVAAYVYYLAGRDVPPALRGVAAPPAP